VFKVVNSCVLTPEMSHCVTCSTLLLPCFHPYQGTLCDYRIQMQQDSRKLPKVNTRSQHVKYLNLILSTGNVLQAVFNEMHTERLCCISVIYSIHSEP